MRNSDSPLLVGIAVYFVSSLGGVTIVKFLNYRRCFASWRIFALISRSTWTLSGALHLALRRREGIAPRVSARQRGSYCLVATGLSLVEAVNSYSMVVLPGSLYMLLKGSDVGWSMALSRLVLKKKYGVPKLAGAALVMSGISAAFFLDVIRDDTRTPSSEDSNAGPSVSTAAILCLGGAFLNSLCSVLTEAVLKQNIEEEQERLRLQTQQSSSPPSKLMQTNAYSMYTSFFSFLLLLPLSLVYMVDQNKEERHLSVNNNSNSTTVCPDGEHAYETSPAMHLVIGLCLASLAVLRFSERLCKHFICVHDSAVTFSMVQAARRWLGIYVVGWIFREDFAEGMIAGSLISGVGFVLHGHGASRTEERSAEHRDYKKLASNLNLPSLDDKESVTVPEEIELSSGDLTEVISMR